MTVLAHPRLVRADIAAHPDGGTIVTTPRGRQFRVHLSAEELRDLLSACDGTAPLQEVAASRPRAPEVRTLLDRLEAEGCLATGDHAAADWVRFGSAPEDPGRPARTDLVVVGSGRLATFAADLWKGLAGGRFRSVDSMPTVEEGTALGDDQVLVVVLDRPDHARLATIETRCECAGTPWSAFLMDGSVGRFGPHVLPGRGPAWSDLAARRIAAAGDPSVVTVGMSGTGDGYLPPAAELAWMLSAYLVDVERWLAGADALGDWSEVELDPVALRTVRRAVLPLPDRPRSGAVPAWISADPFARLVDERLGIVTGIRTVPGRPGRPTGLTVVQALGCDIGRVSRWCNDPVGGGTSVGDPVTARRSAVGEVIERYCGNIVRSGALRLASYDEIVAGGDDAVDPDRLVLFSAAQYAAPGFPFVPLTRDRRVHWVPGRSLTRDIPSWVPASLVYVNWYGSGPDEGRPVNDTFYAGIAAGASLEDAVCSGLEEVIERHATMVWWLNRQPLAAARPSGDLRMTWPEGDGGPRRWLVPVDNEFDVPVMAGVVEDVDRRILTIGFAARADPAEAAIKAWSEALILQDISRDLAEPDSLYHRVVAGGRLPDQRLKAWRADRRYLDDYRDDFRDVSTLICQSQVYLDPRAIERVRPWVDTPARRSVDDLPRLDGRRLDAYREPLEAAGHEIYYVDVTTPDVAATGLRVTRTIVPGLIANSAAAFPYLGNRVAQDSAVRLGWRVRPRAERDLTVLPVPHA